MLELDRPSSLLPLCTELTIPDVIVFRKAKGLPIATTNSPCRISDDRPRASVGKGFCMSGERKSSLTVNPHCSWVIHTIERIELAILSMPNFLAAMTQSCLYNTSIIKILDQPIVPLSQY